MKKALFTLLAIVVAQLLWLSSATAMTKQTLSTSEMERLNKNIIETVNKHYIKREQAEELVKNLRFKAYSGDFNASMPVDSFVDTINLELKRASGDNTMSITFSGNQEQQKRASIKTEHFNEKISYLGFEGDFIGSDTIKALNQIKDVFEANTLILDLTETETMDEENFIALASQFTPQGSHLGSIQYVDPITQSLSYRPLISSNAGKKANGKTSVIIINSSFVSGYWELFTLSMQRLKNATVVGQDTMGVTELNKDFQLPFGLELNIPNMSIGNIDGEPTWQGIGVAAEHYVKDEKAIETAVKIALEVDELGLIK